MSNQNESETKLDLFCSRLFNRYYECLRINIGVFGKERGLIMCEEIKNIIEYSECKKSECELNLNMDEYIDKLAETVKKD